MSCVNIINISKSLLQNHIIRSSYISLKYYSCQLPQDIKTHTGQEWEPTDYRLARFVDRPKQVNKEFAIDLIAQVPPKPCKERVVCCDGGDDHTGHPRVYINLDKPGNHSCGYCGLRFYLEHCH